jgi:hypothetical protein
MEYEVVKVYEDEVSGAKSREKRPAYNQLIKDAFLKRFDLIIGWDVSRFGRSMKEFVSFLSDMDDKGRNPLPPSFHSNYPSPTFPSCSIREHPTEVPIIP